MIFVMLNRREVTVASVRMSTRRFTSSLGSRESWKRRKSQRGSIIRMCWLMVVSRILRRRLRWYWVVLVNWSRRSRVRLLFRSLMGIIGKMGRKGLRRARKELRRVRKGGLRSLSRNRIAIFRMKTLLSWEGNRWAKISGLRWQRRK